MSAWLVSETHIDVLVNALISRELIGGLNPEEIGFTMWAENVKSVSFRYPDDDVTAALAAAKAYTYATPLMKLSPTALLKQVDCYDYQSCEHPGYESSQARQWVVLLTAALRVEGATTDGPEYNRAPWGIDEE